MSNQSRIHREAAAAHDAAAERHLESAAYWEECRDGELAELERRNAEIEVAAAQLERDRASVIEKRETGVPPGGGA